MKLAYLYDEFMHPPEGFEGKSIYIIDDELNEGYKISQNIQAYRYFLAEQVGAQIYKGKTMEILNHVNQQTPISSIITKSTFRPLFLDLFQEIEKDFKIDFLNDYFLSTDNFFHPAKRFFQYWNKIKKNLKY